MKMERNSLDYTGTEGVSGLIGVLPRRLHLHVWFSSGSVFSTQTPLSLSVCLWLSFQRQVGDGQAGGDDGDNLPSARQC